MPMSVEQLKKEKGYRESLRGVKRTSLTATLGNFLRENVGLAFTAEELIQNLNQIGMKVRDEKQLHTAAISYNGKQFRDRHPEVRGKIVMGWYKPEGAEKPQRVFYYE